MDPKLDQCVCVYNIYIALEFEFLIVREIGNFDKFIRKI